MNTTNIINKIKVDYNQNLESMIVDGQYDWKDSGITADRFSINGDGLVEVETILFHFDHSIYSEEAKLLIEEAGWKVAKIEHVLAYGAAYPDEQKKYPILALGSVGEVLGSRYVLVLGWDGSERGLRLSYCVGAWNDHCRFLAVRKSGIGSLEPKNSALGTSETLNLESAIETVKKAGYLIYKKI